MMAKVNVVKEEVEGGREELVEEGAEGDVEEGVVEPVAGKMGIGRSYLM